MERVKSIGPRGAGAEQDVRGDVGIARGGGADQPYVYALGEIALDLPTPGIRREFARVAERQLGVEELDAATIRKLLARPENRYLARMACWVLAREGVPVYLVRPRDPADLDLLIESLHPEPGPSLDEQELALVIGVQGEVDPQDVCGELQVPVVYFDQIESVIREELLEAVRPRLGLLGDIGARYLLEVEGVLERILRLAGDGGSLDEYRALSYLAVRYPEIYLRAVEAFERGYELTDVQHRPAVIEDDRKIVDVIFVYTNPETGDVEQTFARVDVTEEYPFLVAGLAPYPPATPPAAA